MGGSMRRLIAAAIPALYLAVGCEARSQAILNPVIGGTPVHCVDATGAPVYTLLTAAIPDVAMSTIEPASGARIIEINPGPFSAMSRLMQLFIYAHECGHHISGDVVAGLIYHHDNPVKEQNADRIGIRIMRDQVRIKLSDAWAIGAQFENNPGIPGYLPGPLRRIWIIECYRTNSNNCDTDLTYSYTTTYPDTEISADFCVGLKKVVSEAKNNFTNLKGVHRLGNDDYYSTYLIADAGDDAFINLNGVNPTYSMYNLKSDADTVKPDVDSCLTGWSEADSRGKSGASSYIYSNSDDSVEVHLAPSSIGGSVLRVENSS